MPTIVTGIFTNWLTSAFGTAVGVQAIIDVINHGMGADWKTDIPQLATMILGLMAKDYRVSGKPAGPTK